VLSCILFLIYTLDLPLLLHDIIHNPSQEMKCSQPSTSTYIDDWIITIREICNRTLQQGIDTTMSQLHDYMSANLLVMNAEKTILMVIAKHPDKAKQVVIPNADPELIVHPSNQMKILGTYISNKLKWNFNLIEANDSLVKQLQKRLVMLRLLAKSAPFATMKNIANGIIMSKLLYGMETWGVAPMYIQNKLQSIQLEACRIINGRISQRWTTTHLLKTLNWLPIKDLITLTSAKMSHKILNNKGPAYLTQVMTQEIPVRDTRLTGPDRLGAPPRYLGRTNITKSTYRYQAYGHFSKLPEVLKTIKNVKTFNKRLTRYLKNNCDLPRNNCQHVQCLDKYNCRILN
jgi:hypothetical protein